MTVAADISVVKVNAEESNLLRDSQWSYFHDYCGDKAPQPNVLPLPYHSLSLKEMGAGTQADQEPRGRSSLQTLPLKDLLSWLLYYRTQDHWPRVSPPTMGWTGPSHISQQLRKRPTVESSGRIFFT